VTIVPKYFNFATFQRMFLTILDLRFGNPYNNTVNPLHNGLGYNGQNLAGFNCEFLEMLRH
jgi:hypothetical protein